MFKKLVPAVFFIAFLFLSTGSILAEAVVVKGDKIFVADNTGLSVLNLADGSAATACSGEIVPDLTTSAATDVDIADNGTAVVTNDTGGSVVVVQIVDVSPCLVGVGVGACDTIVDLDAGIMKIPCLKVGTDTYNIEMEQRGNSMNWKVTFIDGEPAPDL